MHYDYLIAGAGLFGAVFAHEMHKQGRKVLVVEKRDHIAGNIYTEKVMGINVHRYGAHIFHTSDEEVWNYVNQYARFNHYVNSPVAVYRDELYNLPFNMNTFSRMWNIKTPKEAKEIIAKQTGEFAGITPQNLEEQALQLAGRDVYEKLVKGYTEKQWGRDCKDLPAFIIRRLPLRFTYDNNYFNDRFQGIPEGGYTQIVEKLFASGRSNTVPCGLKPKSFRKRITIRATQLSTTRNARFLTPASSSTSISSSRPEKEPSSRESIPRPGKRVTNRTIRSTMRKTAHSMHSIQSLRKRKQMSCSADAWDSINIMIWIKLSGVHWTW